MSDEWANCYQGDWKKAFSQSEFKERFCNTCAHATCKRAAGPGAKWGRRMDEQRRDLIDDPKFADVSDPRYQHLRSIDFPNMIQEALRIHISERKGDWSVTTDEEVRAEAAKMGLPVSFAAPAPVIEDPLEGMVTGQWRIRGDSKKIWTVTQFKNGSFACDCPIHAAECKHITDVRGRLAAAQKKAEPLPFQPPVTKAPIVAPPSMNTAQPEGGVTLGTPAPAPINADPWEPTPSAPKPKIIPVGGRVTFKK